MSVDPSYGLLRAVRSGNINMVKILIDKYGLSYSKSWSKGYNLLREAVERKQTEVARILLNCGSKVNSKSKKRTDTPLHFAVRNGNLEMVDMLLEKDANVNAKDHAGETPLHCAVYEDYPKIVISLLKKRAYADTKSSEGMTALHLAAESGNEKMAEILLKHGACINCKGSAAGKYGYTPLHYAITRGHDKLVELLLRRGADINATEKEKFTPLHLATQMGYDTIVKLLLEHGGISIYARDEKGKTVLDIAIENGDSTIINHILEFHPELNNPNNRNYLRIALYGPDNDKCHRVVEALLKHGFTVYPDDVNNSYLFHAAVEKGFLKIIQDLIKYGADTNSVYPLQKGYTLLHNAAEKKQLGAAKILLSNGADVNAKADDGKFPISFAIENLNVEMVELLFDYGADIKNRHDLLYDAVRTESIKIVEMILENDPEIDINVRDNFGRNALLNALYPDNFDHGAVCYAQATQWFFRNTAEIKRDLAKLLLSRGADVNALSTHGLTPLHAAVHGGHPRVVEILLDHNADVNSVTDYDTALHCCARDGSETISKMLLDKGANVNIKGTGGKTALHVACVNQHRHIVTTLLKYGAEIDARDDDAVSPLQISAIHGSLEIVEILLENFADVESRDSCGKTALHSAAKHGCPEIVEILLNYGSDVNATCKNGRTPLYYAMLGTGSIQHEQNEQLLYRYDQDFEYDFGDDEYFDYYNYHHCLENDSEIDEDDYSDFFDDDCSLNNDCRSDEVADILELHIMKIRALNLHVSEENCGMVDFNVQHKDFHDDCKREIEIMRNSKINDTNVSYHDLLIKGINQLVLYARNEIIVDTLESGDYRAMFPVYSNLISNNFRKGQKRESLLNLSLKALDFLSGFALPELSSLKLLSYLKNKDLESLIKAGPDSDGSEPIA